MSNVDLPMARGASKVEMKSRHLAHMTSEFDLEVRVEVLPAEPRQSCGELFLSQLSVPDTIQACKATHTHKSCSLGRHIMTLHLAHWIYLHLLSTCTKE